MYKIVNFLLIIIILFFFYSIYNYYSSNVNIKNVNLNRLNIKEIIDNKVANVTILENDTNDVIEFNSLFSEEIKDNKKRKFWDLLN